MLVLEDFHTSASASADVNVPPISRKVPKEKRAQVYSVEKLLEGKSPAIVELFRHLQKAIIGLGDNVEEAPVKLYVAYKTTRNFCEVEIQSKQLKMFLDIPLKELDDPKKKSRDVSEVGHWGTGDTQVIFDTVDEIEYIMSLVRQSYERTL